MKKTIQKTVTGYPTVDGAGVQLIRVLGNATVKDFDPFLMLDSFDTDKYDDYKEGFPMHPHRGIETISYLSHGRMQHADTLGFTDTVSDGEVQWMTAGSGIEHEERIPRAERLCGIQLWLNLPEKEKMASPYYHAIHKDDIPEVELPDGKGTLRVLAGAYGDVRGYQSRHLPLTYYALRLNEDASLTLSVDPANTTMLFSLEGEADVEGEHLSAKTAALLSVGDEVTITAASPDTEILFLSAPPLHEKVAWGGPIVMNTTEQLYAAFDELQEGTFLKEQLQHD
jgi:redox-sensitive bicupin YhaK (pirin superfamily)